WDELKQCADRLMSLDPVRAVDLKARATKLKVRVAGEQTAQRVAGFEAALRDHDLRRARAELEQPGVDPAELLKLKSRYAAAETLAISTLAEQLERAKSPDCAAYNQILTRERAAQPAHIADDAARRAPCTPAAARCDTQALTQQGRQLEAANKP